MASPNEWTWVWATSGCWQWTGKSALLQFRGSQSIGHNWVTELNLTGCSTRPSQEMEWGLTLLRNSAGESVSPECNPLFVLIQKQHSGLPWWLNGKQSTFYCRHGFDPCSGEDSTCWGATKPVCHNFWACAREPGSCSCCWSCHAQSLCSATRKATAMRSPCTAAESSPCSLQLEKNLPISEDPTQPK